MSEKDEVEESIEDIEDIDDIISDDASEEKQHKKVRIKKKPVICLISAIVVVAVIGTLLAIKIFDNKYIVKFNSNGGTSVEKQKVKENDKVSKPKDPTREGYNFEGWYLDDKMYDFDSKVTSNITLEAKWTSNNSADVSGVTLDRIELAILPGDTTHLIATVTPSDAKDKSVIFKSSNEDIVTVDNDGLVTALKIGVATVTVTTTDGGYTAECKIVVSNDVIKVTGVILSDKNITLGVSESRKISATVTPDNATNKGITWTSSDNNVASVSSLGVVTANSKGTAIITASTKDGDFTEKVTVTVDEVKPESVSLNKDDITIAIGEETTLVATVLPRNASVKDVSFKSEDTNIVTVDSNGKVVGKKEGVTNVVVSTKEGNKTAKCKVIVKKPVAVTSVKLNKHSLTLDVGKSETLKYAVLPTTAVNQAVKWSSSDTAVVTINNGLVTAVGSGTATITITTLEGEKTDSCTVTVKGTVSEEKEPEKEQEEETPTEPVQSNSNEEE